MNGRLLFCQIAGYGVRMGIIDSVARAFGQKQVTASPEAVAMLTGHASPQDRNRAKLIESFNTHPNVRSVVGRVADGVASVNWRIFANSTPNGKAKRNVAVQRAVGPSRRRMLKELNNRSELREVLMHPFLDMLHEPNRFMTGIQARKTSQVYVETAGESLWVIYRDKNNVAREYLLVNPEDVERTPTEKEPWFVLRADGAKWNVPISEVFWFRNINPSDPYGRGMGIIHALADELDIAEFSAKQISSFFFNKGVPSAIISIDGASPSALKRAKALWAQEHRGFSNAYRSQWTSGKIDVQTLETNFKDMNLVELRKHTQDTLIQTFGIPPEIVGRIENSNKATITGAEYIFAQYVLVPRLELLREAFQRFCEREYDSKIIVDYDTPVQFDREFQLTVMTANKSIFSANDWRSIADVEDLPTDLHVVGSSERAVLELEDLVVDDVQPVGDAPPANPPDEDTGDDEVAPEPPPDEGDDVDEGKSIEQKSATKKGFTAADADKLLNSLSAEPFRKRLRRYIEDLAEEQGQEVLSELVDDEVFNLQNPIVADKIHAVMTERFKQVTSTTRDALEKSLLDGIFLGESTEQLAERIEVFFRSASKRRAQLFAKDLVHEIANAANFSAMKQSGVVNEKQWVTSFVRSRETHRELNGQVRAMADDFNSSSGFSAPYPHAFGVASEDIHCGCTTTAVIHDPKSMDAIDKIAEDYHRFSTGWSAKFATQIRRAYRDQRDALLDALDLFG